MKYRAIFILILLRILTFDLVPILKEDPLFVYNYGQENSIIRKVYL